MKYRMNIAGLDRDLPLCKVSDDLYIGAFVMFGDASGAKEYFVARKGLKVYMPRPLHVTVRSITTQHDQDLYLSGEEADKIRGKRVLIVDDVISTGESLRAMEELVEKAGGTVAGRMAVLAEGDAQERKDIIYLNKLPVFNADGTVKE